MSTTTTAAAAAQLASDEGSIPVLRGQIDSIDEAVIRLVAERARLSAARAASPDEHRRHARPARP